MSTEAKRTIYLARLREQLVQYFTRDQFIVLCADIGEDYDELPASGQELQANELLRRLENVGRIPDLVSYCSEKRPKVSWDDPDTLGGVFAEALSELKGDLATFQASFQSALQQIDVLSDYKDLHDYLHDLQFGWFPLVQEKVDSLPDAKGAIQDLVGYERDFRTAIGQLNDTVNNNKVADTERNWINRLEEARKTLRQGLRNAEPDMNLINAAILSIGQELDTQPTSINRDLMSAIGALRLADLRKIVQLVLDKLIKKAPDSDLVKQFQQGIVELTQMNSDLDALMEEHDIWQANEGKVQMLQLHLDLKDLLTFSKLWRQMKEKTSPLYTKQVKEGSEVEEWASDLQSDQAQLDQAIKDNDLSAVRSKFDLFCKDAKQRFWDVDKLIKKKCKELIDIRSKMPPDKNLT